MRQEVENFFNSSTIHGFKYLSKKFHWIERLFWSIFLLFSLITTIFFMTQLIMNINEVPVITHIADHRISIKDINFPAITVCSGFEYFMQLDYENFLNFYEKQYPGNNFQHKIKNLTEEYKLMDKNDLKDRNYIYILKSIANGTIKTDNLGTEILKRLQVIDIMMNQGVFAKLNLSITTDDIFDIINEFHPRYLVGYNWNQHIDTKFSLLLTEYGHCTTFNLAFPREIYFNDSISDNFDHTYFSIYPYYLPYNKIQKIPRRVTNIDDTLWLSIMEMYYVITETFKFKGHKLMIHDPYELPSRHSQSVVVNVRENPVTILEISPEMFDIDESLYDDDPMDRNCYFDDEFELKLFKVYTKSNCESECLTNYMIKKCGCVEFYMIRNCTTRICSASDKNCYDEAKNSFENQKHQCNCLQPCTFVKMDIKQTFGSTESSEQDKILGRGNTMQFGEVYIKFQRDSFSKFVRKQSFDFVTFLSFVGGFLGLFAGFSLLSAVELFYWFFVRIFTRKCNRKTIIVHPINEEIKKEPNIVKDFFKNSSIHGLSYAIDTNLIEKLFWTFFVSLSITSCILMSLKISSFNTIVYEDSTLLKNKLNFPAVTFIPSYYVDKYFHNQITQVRSWKYYAEFIDKFRTTEEYRKNMSKYSGFYNFVYNDKRKEYNFETYS